MNILVNERFINSFLDEKNFNTQLKEMLNRLIDEELEKDIDEMDCDLIDECTEMLIQLEQQDDNGFSVIVPLVSSEKIMNACGKKNFKMLSRPMRAAIIACIVILSAATTNTVIAKIFNYNIAQEVVNSISQKLQDLGIVSAKPNEIVIDDIPEKTENEEISVLTETTKPSAESKQNSIISSNISKPVEENNTTQNNIVSETVQTYTITLDADGGTCSPDSIQVSYGEPIGNLPTPEKEGYLFTGWYNDDISYRYYNGKKQQTAISRNTIYNLKQDSVITAYWLKLRTIILNPNGGTCDTDKIYISSANNENNIFDLPVPKKDGYIFLGWYINGIDMLFKDTQYLYDFSSSSPVLNALWVKEGELKTIKLNPNGGVCDIKSKDVIYGKTVGELPVPERAGWKFLGWYTYTNTLNEQITADTVVDFAGVDTLYALWYKTSATITFDADGGECDVKSKTIYSHNYYGTLPNPTKEGYIFRGWVAHLEDGLALVYEYSDVGEKAVDHTLVAMWTPIEVDFYFNANGGVMTNSNDEIDTFTFKYNTEFGVLPTAARVGYKFDGWYTKPEGGTKISETDIVTSNEGTVFYAHWIKDENICLITLYNDNSADETTVITRNKGEKLNASKLNTMLYTFDGWYTERYYGEKVSNDYIVNEDIVLYGHWVPSGNIIDSFNLEKTVYQLNEKIDINSISILLIDGKTELSGDMLAENFMARLLYDTSTYGKHTVTLQFIFGIATIETSTEIFVEGCSHDTGTHIVNYIQPTCLKEGYSGDLACNGCNEIISSGTVLPKASHDDNTETKIINAKEPTCSQEGYTGDKVCVLCGEIIEKGETIHTIPHGETHQVITKATFSKIGKIADVCNACNSEVASTTVSRAYASISQSSYVYDGTMKTPKVTVKNNIGTPITDYTVTMEEGRTEIGNYDINISINNEYYEDETVITFSIKPPQVTGFTITPIKNGFSAQWDAVEGASSYQIKCEQFGSSSTSLTTITGLYNTAKINSLTKGKTYYVYIRVYKDGVYSDWTPFQKITIS